jgi:hypothetical protein
MNKKSVTAPIAVLIVLALGAMLVARMLPLDGVASGENVQILKDSVKTPSGTLYWFENGSALGSPALSYMSLGGTPCSLADGTAIIKGEFIYAIDFVRSDTVYIYAHHGVDVNDRFNPNRLVFVTLDTIPPGVSRKRQSLSKDVVVSSICK